MTGARRKIGLSRAFALLEMARNRDFCAKLDWKDRLFHNVFHRCGNLGEGTEVITQAPAVARVRRPRL